MNKMVTIKIKYLDQRYTVLQVPITTPGLTWLWVAQEAFRLISLSMDYETRRKFSKLQIKSILSPQYEYLDLSKRILHYDINKINSQHIYTLIMAGNLDKLINNHKIMILISSFLELKKHVLSLILINKAFKALFTSDIIWENINYKYLFSGKGLYGNEYFEWNVIRVETGISIMNMNKLQWMAHNTSRLKLFYGSLDDQHHSSSSSSCTSRNRSNSIFDYLFNNNHDPPKYNNNINKFYIIINCTDQTIFNKTFMSKLHYVVPESATSYHFRSKDCVPLLHNSRLTHTEPSPTDSRSRRHLNDPGRLSYQYEYHIGYVINMNII